MFTSRRLLRFPAANAGRMCLSAGVNSTVLISNKCCTLPSSVSTTLHGKCYMHTGRSSELITNRNGNDICASTLNTSMRHATDAHTSASIVIIDHDKAAKERDRMARELLNSNFPEKRLEQRIIIQLRDIVHTVPYSLTIAIEDTEEKDKINEMAQSILNDGFEMVDKHLNCWNEASEVSQINRLPVGVKHTMSPHLKKVMECCLEVYRVSGGCFNPAVLPAVRRLRAAVTRSNSHDESLTISKEEAEAFTLPNSFDIDLEHGTIARSHDLAELDFNALNKGYTVDYIVDKLVAGGLENVLFEWGGDCRGAGTNVRRQPWAVGIVRPPSLEELHASISHDDKLHDNNNDGENNNNTSTSPLLFRKHTTEKSSSDDEGMALLRVLTLSNEAIATSGDYENLVTSLDNKIYTSTFDWQQCGLLQPSFDSLAQVTIRCYSCMYADALATAALVKRDPIRVRYLMEHYRYNLNTVTDYAAYTRNGERLAHMFEIARESPERRSERIAGSLPARVIVIGGGLAGCSAAIEAANCGAQVIMLEKETQLGGNSAKATSGINGWGTRAQAQQGIDDGGKFFERDTYRSGKGGSCEPGLVKMLSVKSADAIKWLTDFGIPLTVLSQLGGASRKRCHRAPDCTDGTPLPIGFTIMRTLEHHIRENMSSKITILTECVLTKLIHEEQNLADGNRQVRVNGIRYKSLRGPDSQEMDLLADAVILATGGYSNDQSYNSLLREFTPKIFGTPTTNGPWATGDGVKAARELGATLVDMDKVQLHPTGLIDPKDPASQTKYLGPEALRGSGGVLINKNGERFVNELDLRSVVSQAIIAQDNVFPASGGARFAYCVLNEEAAKLFGFNTLRYYWKAQGLFTRVEDVEELTKLIGCEKQTLQDTLQAYELSCKTNSVCTATGKTVFPCVLGPQGPFYVAYVTPSIHYTMGGCLISASAEVLMTHRAPQLFEHARPILGLFGAGEVTGGVHGQNRLGGNSLLECVVFGRIAGDRAATILQKKNNALSTDEWTPVVVSEVRAGDQFGTGSRVLRFNLPGAIQRTGLALGQFIGIRGEWDGQQLVGYYSPITLPDQQGQISILARGKKGNVQEWINALQPGDAVEMKACGGLKIDLNLEKKQIMYKKVCVRKFAMIAGGSGIAPMLQIIRALLNRPFVDNLDTIRLVYAAEDENELTYRQVLSNFTTDNPEKFVCEFVLNNPPEKWTGGVGYIDKNSLRKCLQPPSNDLLVAICGPPVMQRMVRYDLLSLGYDPKLVRTIDEDMTP